jgi:hypothetical protein
LEYALYIEWLSLQSQKFKAFACYKNSCGWCNRICEELVKFARHNNQELNQSSISSRENCQEVLTAEML